MIEVNCSHWVNNCNLRDFSDSIANSGDPQVGPHTWAAAQAQALADYQSGDLDRIAIHNTKDRWAVISFFKEFGAWSIEELTAMNNIDLTALIIQYIAGNYLAEETEMESDDYNGSFYKYNGDLWTTLSI
jgi:hypothetical protein